MTTVIRLFAALCAALLTVTVVDAAPARAAAPAQAKVARADTSTEAARGGCRVPRCFGAISMSPDQGYGAAWDHGGKLAARQAAHRRCKANSNYPGQCVRMGWVRNGCMAVAIATGGDGWIDRWAVGYGRSLRAAKRQAVNRNNGGHIRAAFCTTRRY